MRSKTRNVAVYAMVVVLAIVLAATMGLSVFSGVSIAANNETATKLDEITIGHMSDIHYFPLEHCYQDVHNANYKDSDFYYSMTGDTKLVLESGLVLNTAIQQIIKDGWAGTAPQYLIASGDLSKNGERVALIDVANSLRYLQNTMRSIPGYENFQVLTTVGNHDLYNHNGSLYSQEDGSARPADMVTAAQFALIFEGLGFPNLTMDTLSKYFPEDYWWSEYTQSNAYPDGFVHSENADNLKIEYYSEALTKAVAKINASASAKEILDCYFEIGDELNQLTYFVEITDKTDYSFAVIDSTDRETTDHGALVRISQDEYNKLSPEQQKATKLYLDDGNEKVNVDLENSVPAASAFSSEKAVYRRTPVQHITGGRITTDCLNWVEEKADAQNAKHDAASLYEETIIGIAHHNILPHFEQEDDILKDFTLYNWEYTANRFLDMGIRYLLSGHMHASDAMSYTDAQGRTFYDFETGSTISYSSPRRYLTLSRNDCDGKLGEQLISKVHILGDITKTASTHIPDHSPISADWVDIGWDDSAYQTAISAYNAIPEANVAERAAAWQDVIRSNADYLTFIIRYDEFATLTDNFDESELGSLYNNFITTDIYGILVDRVVDHFINESTIYGYLDQLHELILGLDAKADKSFMVATVLSTLGVDGKTLDIAASYLIDTVLNNLYGETGYVYDGVKYGTALDYVVAIVNHILDFEYGDATVGANANNPNAQLGEGDVYVGNVGKLKVREIASFIMMAHSTGNELSLDETYESINAKFGANDKNYGEDLQDENDINKYRYKQPTNPVYRKRMLAALKDLNAQLVSGQLVQDLLDALLDPLFRDDNSLIKTLLDYPFDFSQAEWENDTQYNKFHTLLETRLNNLISTLRPIINAYITLPDDLSLSYDAASVSLNDILADLLPVAKPLVGDLLGFNMQGDTLVEIVENLLDGYITDSFLVGLGGIANNIVLAFATDVYPDISYETYDTSADFYIQPYAGYTYGEQKMSYVSSKNVVSTVGAAFNAATQDNGRVPSRVTANFDTQNNTTAYTVKFYTAEDVYGTFKYKTSVSGEWISLSTSKANADADADYFDSTAEATVNGITVSMLTQTKPVYLPLIDLGLACLTHAEIEDDNDVPYVYGDRDKAPKNSVVYWNVTTVTITGLSAGTTYYYDLEGYIDGYKDNGFSLADFVNADPSYDYDKPYFTLTTAKDASADKFEFLTIADIQGMIQGMYDDSYKAVKALLADDNTKTYDFILNAGDMCDNGKNFNQWAYALNTYQTFFANTSTFFAAGNHENGSNAMANYFNYTLDQQQETVDGMYYSFDYGNAHFTVLNTNDADDNGLGENQLAWLENDLKSSRAKWKFVLMHKSIYSGGSHSTDGEVVAMRTQLQKLFAETGVSIVFGGHDHTYTTTYLVDKNGNAIDKTDNAEIKYTQGGGVLYITLGTMGTKFYNYKENSDIIGNFDEDKSILETLTSQTFGKVVVDGDTITYTGYRYDKANDAIVKIGENKLTPAPKSSGLSLGAKIAIGIVVPVVVLAIVAVVVIVVLKKQQEKKRKEELRRKKIAALKRAKALQAAKAAAEQANAQSVAEAAPETQPEQSPEQPEETEQPDEQAEQPDTTDNE
ncbi:MAG: metallophosphoesterase [Bacteroides sp.]|nr:metallophosphoesterase [Bacillota bacterium]MCM1393911.1 metallophosphoesterase [[Eubacterium] siraeum]MCM1456005.1 metallophosphoesterase [Bacteroides sp.]